MVIIVNQLLDVMRLRKELSSQEIATDIRLLTLFQTNKSVFPPRRTVGWLLTGGWWLLVERNIMKNDGSFFY